MKPLPTESFTTCLRFYLCNCMSQRHDFEYVAHIYPAPRFEDEEHAFEELSLIISYISGIQNEGVKFDAIRSFLEYKIYEHFLAEAPSYRLFYEMKVPEWKRDLDIFLAQHTR